MKKAMTERYGKPHRSGDFRGVIFILLVLITATGCVDHRKQPKNETNATPIIKTFHKEGVDAFLGLNTDNATLADEIILTIGVDAREDIVVVIGLPEEPAIPRKAKGPVSGASKLLEDGRLRHLFTYAYTPFLPGDYKIGPFTLKCRDDEEDKEITTLELEAVKVHINSILPANEEVRLKEIFPPESLPLDYRYPAAGIGAFLLLTGLGVFLFFRRKKGNGEVKLPKIPPHERALKALAELAATGVPGEGRRIEYVTRISDILRRYLEGRYGLRATEQTTEEFLEAMRDCPELDRSQRELLTRFLQQCDLIKFAGLEPAAEDCGKVLEKCRDFIKESAKNEETDNSESTVNNKGGKA